MEKNDRRKGLTHRDRSPDIIMLIVIVSFLFAILEFCSGT